MPLDPTSEWPWPVVVGRVAPSARRPTPGTAILSPLPITTATVIPLSWAPAGPTRPLPALRSLLVSATPILLQPILTPTQTGWQARSTYQPHHAPAFLGVPQTVAPPPLAAIANETTLILATAPTVTQPQGLTAAVTQPYALIPTVTQPTGLLPEVQ